MIHESWEHRTVRITRHGNQNTVQDIFIILGHRHRPLHVRTLLAKRKKGKSEIHPVHGGPPFFSRLLHKENATSRAPLREEIRRRGILHRQPAQEKVQKVLPGYPRWIRAR